MVSFYSGLNFNEVLELDVYTFAILLKDAFIERMSETKEGQDYLEQAWILTQTEPDRKALKEVWG